MTNSSNLKDEASLEVLFPADLPAENVVRAVLILRQSCYELELERLNGILADFPAFYTDQLAAAWSRLRAESYNDLEALCRFTKIITVGLNGGNGPVA